MAKNPTPFTDAQIASLRKCFDFRGVNISDMYTLSDYTIAIYPNDPWDIERAHISCEMGDFSVALDMKGGDTKTFTCRTISEAKKVLKFYRG